MTHTCELRGRQMFAVGGRLAWQDDDKAGCYTMPAFVYDIVDQTVKSKFDVSHVFILLLRILNTVGCAAKRNVI